MTVWGCEEQVILSVKCLRKNNDYRGVIRNNSPVIERA